GLTGNQTLASFSVQAVGGSGTGSFLTPSVALFADPNGSITQCAATSVDIVVGTGTPASPKTAPCFAPAPSPSPSPSPTPTATVVLNTACSPLSADPRFSLTVGSAGAFVGCNGSTGDVLVSAGQPITVAETIAKGSFFASLQCGGSAPVSGSGTTVSTTITPTAGARTTCTVTNTRCIAGDVNCSTKVDAVDALCVLRNVAGLAPTSACAFTPSSSTDPVWLVSKNNPSISAVDALCILRSVAMLGATQTCPTLPLS
ncbi:MAG: hypothetical protein ACR2PL_00815, partial [Dehalococcoidia bacterium]